MGLLWKPVCACLNSVRDSQGFLVFEVKRVRHGISFDVIFRVKSRSYSVSL